MTREGTGLLERSPPLPNFTGNKDYEVFMDGVLSDRDSPDKSSTFEPLLNTMIPDSKSPLKEGKE